MDPASIFGITSTALSIALKIGSTVQRLNSLKSKFDSADIIIGSLTRKLTTIQHAIKNIRAWGDDVKEQPVPYSDEFQEALDTSINGCSEMLEALNVEISNIFSDGEANSWQKGKFLWKENLLKEYMGYMDGEVHALNLLLTSYQCRTSSEQSKLLREDDSRRILDAVSESRRSIYDTSICSSVSTPSIADTDSASTIRAFGFDNEIMKSRVYRQTPAKARTKLVISKPANGKTDSEAKEERDSLEKANQEEAVKAHLLHPEKLDFNKEERDLILRRTEDELNAYKIRLAELEQKIFDLGIEDFRVGEKTLRHELGELIAYKGFGLREDKLLPRDARKLRADLKGTQWLLQQRTEATSNLIQIISNLKDEVLRKSQVERDLKAVIGKLERKKKRLSENQEQFRRVIERIALDKMISAQAIQDQILETQDQVPKNQEQVLENQEQIPNTQDQAPDWPLPNPTQVLSKWIEDIGATFPYNLHETLKVTNEG